LKLRMGQDCYRLLATPFPDTNVRSFIATANLLT